MGRARSADTTIAASTTYGSERATEKPSCQFLGSVATGYSMVRTVDVPEAEG